MPLRCADPIADRSIHAFDLSADEWRRLERKNRETRHLRMPCCSSLVVLKRSNHGTQFFAHKARGTCTTAPESEAHLQLKRMAVDAARANGWKADTEVAGASPSGAPWKADVLATKGKHKVAVEIQWSGQTNDETLRRQQRYREAGVRGLWLLHQPGFPITHDLPAACIGGGLEGGFQALIPWDPRMTARDRNEIRGCRQILPMDKFLDGVFDRRFRFGVPVNVEATVSVKSALIDCWHRSCGKKTRIVTVIDVTFGPHVCMFSVPDMGKHPNLLQTVLKRLPRNLGIGQIKRRYSRTQKRSYMSNGCVHCDRLMGEIFAHEVWDLNEEIIAFPIRISKEWKAAIEGHEGFGASWGVYPPTTQFAR